nr:MAG TPA: hypothetical protein [Bacteriophage sp.]
MYNPKKNCFLIKNELNIGMNIRSRVNLLLFYCTK